MKWFSISARRRRKAQQELAPQLGIAQRAALEQPGVPPGGLPYATYDHMQADAMVQTCLTLKRLGVLAAPFTIEPADATPEARRNADFVEESFSRMAGSPLSILHGAMDAFAKGWSVQEMVWRAEDGKLWLDRVKSKDPSMFGIHVDSFGNVDSLELRVPGEPARELPRGKFVLFANRAVYGNAKGKSDLDAAYLHWKSKKELLGAWKLHLERFASPTVLGKISRSTPQIEQADLLAKLEGLNRSTAITFPDDVDVSTLAAKGEGSAAFFDAIDFHNREIGRAILGQTLTTDEGRRVGSLALGKVHLQVLLLQLEAVRKELADGVMGEQVIRPMIEMNFGSGKLPRFVFASADLGSFSAGILE